LPEKNQQGEDMNTTPEVVQAEMNYRIERAQSIAGHGTTPEQLRAARASHPSWWRRLRVQHRPTHHAA
jgi:hypothetical protein